MTSTNLLLALNYLDQEKWDLAREMIKLEMTNQSESKPIIKFSLGDLDPEIYDHSKLDEWAVADIAGHLGDAYLENGYWTNLKIIMAERYPEAFLNYQKEDEE